METEIIYDLTSEYTEHPVEPETERELKPELEAESEPETETDFNEEINSLEEIEPSSKEETKTITPEDESQKETSSETNQGLSESETAASEDEREVNSFYPVVSSAPRPGSSNILEQMDIFTFSEMDEEAVFYWQENLAACRGSLASCVSLLLFGDIVLCLLLGCLCASIFSRFWKVNR